MKTLCVIPARLNSSRLPRKVLANIHGKPMVQHVWERVRECKLLDRVVIATDSDEIAAAGARFGAEVVMTGECKSGTDRCWEVARDTDAGIVVNIQADEPMVTEIHVARLLDGLDGFDVSTLALPMKSETRNDPNCVKVVVNWTGQAVYFSRAPLAGSLRHVGMYAYRRTALQWFVSTAQSQLEAAERLEQLRFYEDSDSSIGVKMSPYETVAVDTAEDLERVRELMR